MTTLFSLYFLKIDLKGVLTNSSENLGSAFHQQADDVKDNQYRHGPLEVKHVLDHHDDCKADPYAHYLMQFKYLHEKRPEVLIFGEDKNEVVNVVKPFEGLLDHIERDQHLKIVAPENEDDVFDKIGYIYAFVNGRQTNDLENEAGADFCQPADELDPSRDLCVEEIIVAVFEEDELEVHIEKQQASVAKRACDDH